MTTSAILFVQHDLNRREVAATLEALAAVRVDAHGPVDVTVMVPYRAPWPVSITFQMAAARGLAASSALDGGHREAALGKASALATLRHAMVAVRRGGHVARGELVATRDAVPELAMEAVARGAQTVLVASPPHRLSQLLHRDLENRLRHAGVPRVVRITGALDPSLPRRHRTLTLLHHGTWMTS